MDRQGVLQYLPNVAARDIFALPHIPCIVFSQTRPSVPIWHFMEVLMIMYRRYRIFQHPWPRISHFHNKMKTKAWPCQTHWKLLAILHFAWVQDPYFFLLFLHLKSLSWGQRLPATEMSNWGCFQNRGCTRDRFLVLTDLPRSALVASRQGFLSSKKNKKEGETVSGDEQIWTFYLCWEPVFGFWTHYQQ